MNSQHYITSITNFKQRISETKYHSTCASPGIRNKLTEEEIQITDVKIQKLLIMHRGFHPKSSSLSLYTWLQRNKLRASEYRSNYPGWNIQDL